MLAFSHFLFASSLVSSSLAATFNVKVGDGGLKFTPEFVTAAQGDEIIFEFFPKNHTVTQSTLANPCDVLGGGGDTDYMPVAADAARPTKRLVVPDATTPLWFFCKQGNHCSQGMVFAVNPKSPEQMAQYKANALASAGGTPPPQQPSTPPPAGTPKTIPIVVGQGGLTFSPEKVTANVGDILALSFVGGAHTFTQSSFTDPCSPLAAGVDSGPKPGTAAAPASFNYTVTDSKPLWFYCKTGSHCKSGMVLSINAPATGNTHEAFKALATGAPPGGAPAASSTASSTVSTGAPLPTDNTTPGTGPTTGKEIAVTVGQGGALTFSPESVSASVGDTVVLTFVGGSHTFTQSTFADPCNPLAGGVDSGAKPAAGLATPPTFNYTVTDASKPLWFYCKTGAHCKSGMVFSINAPQTGNTHDAFKATATGAAPPTGAPPGAASRINIGGASSVFLAAALAALLL